MNHTFDDICHDGDGIRTQDSVMFYTLIIRSSAV